MNDSDELRVMSLITFWRKKSKSKPIVKRLKIYLEFGPRIIAIEFFVIGAYIKKYSFSKRETDIYFFFFVKFKYIYIYI